MQDFARFRPPARDAERWRRRPSAARGMVIYAAARHGGACSHHDDAGAEADRCRCRLPPRYDTLRALFDIARAACLAHSASKIIY